MDSLTKGELAQRRMTESMLELIQIHGYAGTGLNAVLEHSRAPKGSLYFHFPDGKEQLGERAVALAAERFGTLIKDALGDAASARPAGAIVETALEALAEMMVQGDFRIGCPVSVVALEMGADSERLRAACEQAYQSWITPVADFLAARGHDDAWSRTTASAVISMVEGAMIVARARRDVQPLRDAAQTLRLLLDVPPVGAGS